MKKLLACFLALTLLAGALPALAEEGPGEYVDYEKGYMAVAAPSSLGELLELKARPGADAECLARVYGGTPLWVIDPEGVADGEGNSWVPVEMVGNYEAGVDLKGYLPQESLMNYNSNFAAPGSFFRAQVKEGAPLLEEPRENAHRNMKLYGEVVLLAEIGEDWFLAGKDSMVGYLAADQLVSRSVHFEDAFAVPSQGGETVQVYQDKDMKTAGGWLYSGAPIQVRELSMEEGWAQIVTYGVWGSITDTWDGICIAGFVPLADVMVFAQQWQVQMGLRTGIVKRDIETGAPAFPIPEGASVTVIGAVEGKYLAVYGSGNDAAYLSQFIPEDQLTLTDRPASMMGPAAIGYAWVNKSIYPTEEIEEPEYPVSPFPWQDERFEDESVYLPMAVITGEVTRDGVAYWQLRSWAYSWFYVPKDQCLAWVFEGTDTAALSPHGPGSFTTGEEEQGLWYAYAPWGKAGAVTIEQPGRTTQRYTLEGDTEGGSFYTVYLEPRAQVTLTGDAELRPLRQGEGPYLLPPYPDNYPTDTLIFEGSGRFFCDWQIPDALNSFDLVVEPLPGYEDSYVAVSYLFSPALPSGDRERVAFSPTAPDTDLSPVKLRLDQDAFGCYLIPGEFLEVHHCRIFIFFGNG